MFTFSHLSPFGNGRLLEIRYFAIISFWKEHDPSFSIIDFNNWANDSRANCQHIITMLLWRSYSPSFEQTRNLLEIGLIGSVVLRKKTRMSDSRTDDVRQTIKKAFLSFCPLWSLWYICCKVPTGRFNTGSATYV